MSKHTGSDAGPAILLPYALEWLAAGYAPLPIGMADKHPCISGHHGNNPAPVTEGLVRAWFGNGSGAGLGAATGCGGLELFEFEGRAFAEGITDAWRKLLAHRELMPLWQRIAAGYSEQSPSGGLHVLYRLDGKVPGSTKLAQRPESPAELDAREPTQRERETGVKRPRPVPWIETKGTGGFTVLAPTVKSDGKAWVMLAGGPRSVVTITAAEREALCDAARTLDTWKASRATSPSASAASSSDGAPVRAGNVYASWPDIIVPHGWVVGPDDGQGRQMVRRPGKDDGWSGTISEGGGLWVFSTSTEFEENQPYSKAAAVAVLDGGMDGAAALREYGTPEQARIADEDATLAAMGTSREKIAARADRQRARAAGEPNDSPGGRPEPPPVPEGFDLEAAYGHWRLDSPWLGPEFEYLRPYFEERSAAESTAQQPAGGHPLNLPASFWEARDELRDIRTAAHAGYRPADAVLATVLARLSAMAPPWLRIDTGAGQSVLTTFAALCGPPGAGKSTSKRGAHDLLPDLAWYPGLMQLPGWFADDMPLGSGEGVAELYMGVRTVETVTAQGKKVTKPERYKARDHAFVYADEGGALAKMLERSGATIGATLRSAWAGETIGQANASMDTTRIVPGGSYSLGVVISFQPDTVGPLLGDWQAGTPQRFIYASATDPAIPDNPAPWPGRLTLDWNALGLGAGNPCITVAEEVRTEIRARRLARARGKAAAEPLAEHGDLTRARLAGLLAVLAKRGHVTAEDWQLAGVLWDTSCAVRDSMNAHGHAEAARAEQHIRANLAGRQTAVEDATDERAMARAVRSAGRHVHKAACEGGCKRRCLTRAIASRELRLVTMDEVIGRLTAAGVIEAEGDLFRPGKVAP